MYMALYNIIFISILSLFPDSIQAINGCIVSLISADSIKRKVLCADPKTPIYSIPENLPQASYIVIINEQNITDIKENDFDNLSELTTLSITHSNLIFIHPDSFKSLKQLQLLDLSGNRLTISDHSLPVRTFRYLVSLRILNLSSNLLSLVPDRFFSPMSRTLRILILRNTPLKLSPLSLNDLNFTEELDLRNCSITNLDAAVEMDLRRMKAIRRLLLSANPWNCDCNFRWLYFYLTEIQDSVNLRADDDQSPRCANPHKLLNTRLPIADERNRLKYKDFVCPSRCSSISLDSFSVLSGSVVNFTCQCYADPIQPLVWMKNGHVVEESAKKYHIFQEGKETFQSTLSVLSLQSVDTGNWSCRINDASVHFSLKVSQNSSQQASVNIYIFVGLGSSLLLISLIVVMVFMFCRQDSPCQYRSPHPLVICGYETDIRKPPTYDGDIQFRYNQNDGRFTTSFYENSIPSNSVLNKYHHQHSFADDSYSDKNLLMQDIDHKLIANTIKSSPIATDKMLNIYCGCRSYNAFNSDDEAIDADPIRRNSKHITQILENERRLLQNKPSPAETKPYQTISSTEFEKLFPKIKQCPFHGSSATLTRVPGDKPCPVHGSTATLPSRLSSKRVEHRFGCPKHSSRENVSVKSLKFESPNANNLHRSKSVGRIPTDKADIAAKAASYKPCPLHGDILAAISENMLEQTNGGKSHDEQRKSIPNSKAHSKKTHRESSILKIPNPATSSAGCENRSHHRRIAAEPQTKNQRFEQFKIASSSSIIISQTLTSPVQSSLSSSPLLTSDVHGTLV